MIKAKPERPFPGLWEYHVKASFLPSVPTWDQALAVYRLLSHP